MLRACLEVLPIFGIQQQGVTYTERRAAYAVAFGPAGTVAVVRGPFGRLWLPGGGSLPNESAEDSVSREVREELARGVRLIDWIGEAIQFFHAGDEDRHYRMSAVFFLAALDDAEHELCWLPPDQAIAGFFHECHGWAMNQAMRISGRHFTERTE